MEKKIIITKEIVESIQSAIYDDIKDRDFDLDGTWKEFEIEHEDNNLLFYANITCQGHVAKYYYSPRCWDHDTEESGLIISELTEIEFFDYDNGEPNEYEISEELNKELFAEVEYEWGY